MTIARRNALLALGAALVVLAVILLTGGSDNSYTVRAELHDAGGLRKNSSVKVAGVPAGKVTKIDVTKNDTAIATLRLDKDAAPIGTGARIQVRPTDLLGERYAALDPGNRADPVPSGTLIPANRTSTPVELDDILNTLDPDTRTRLGILLNDVGTGLTGRGTDLAALLKNLPPSLQDIQGLTDQVAGQDAALKDMITRGRRITASIDGRRDDMGRLVDEASTALTTVAEKRKELGATIGNAPQALASLRSTLGNLDTAAVALRPTAADLQRAAQPLDATLKSLPQFADEAAPTLRKATAVAPDLTRLGTQATPTVRRLQPTAKLLTRTLVPAKPALDHMTARGTDDLLYFINNVNRGLQGRDGVGHFIGAHFYLDAEYVSNAINFFNAYHRTASAKRAPLPKLDLSGVGRTVDKAQEKLPLKPLTDKVKQVTDKVKATVKPVTDAVTKDVSKVVGGATEALGGALQPRQQDGGSGGDALRLFDYLMGP